MQEVTMSKDRLLEIVRDNRAKHLSEYAETMTGWRETVEKTLKQAIKEIKAGQDTLPSLPGKPHHNINDYDRAIRMLELSVDDTITLSDHEFQQLVLDEWGWKGAFLAASAMYNSKAG